MELPGYHLLDICLQTANHRFWSGMRQADRKPVLLKGLLHHNAAWGQAWLQREARLLQRVAGSGVVELLDRVEWHGEPWLVFPALTQSLPLDRLPPKALDEADLYTWLRQGLTTLERIHGLGLHHGRIDCSHLLLDPEHPEFLLCGFSRACELPAEPPGLNPLPDSSPLRLFTAPEQSRQASGWVDSRADLYGLGACFCFLASGQAPPPPGITAAELVCNWQISPSVAGLIQGLLARHPRDRWASAQALAAALDRGEISPPPPYFRNRSPLALFLERQTRPDTPLKVTTLLVQGTLGAEQVDDIETLAADIRHSGQQVFVLPFSRGPRQPPWSALIALAREALRPLPGLPEETRRPPEPVSRYGDVFSAWGLSDSPSSALPGYSRSLAAFSELATWFFSHHPPRLVWIPRAEVADLAAIETLRYALDNPSLPPVILLVCTRNDHPVWQRRLKPRARFNLPVPEEEGTPPSAAAQSLPQRLRSLGDAFSLHDVVLLAGTGNPLADQLIPLLAQRVVVPLDESYRLWPHEAQPDFNLHLALSLTRLVPVTVTPTPEEEVAILLQSARNALRQRGPLAALDDLERALTLLLPLSEEAEAGLLTAVVAVCAQSCREGVIPLRAADLARALGRRIAFRERPGSFSLDMALLLAGEIQAPMHLHQAMKLVGMERSVHSRLDSTWQELLALLDPRAPGHRIATEDSPWQQSLSTHLFRFFWRHPHLAPAPAALAGHLLRRGSTRRSPHPMACCITAALSSRLLAGRGKTLLQRLRNMLGELSGATSREHKAVCSWWLDPWVSSWNDLKRSAREMAEAAEKTEDGELLAQALLLEMAGSLFGDGGDDLVALRIRAFLPSCPEPLVAESLNHLLETHANWRQGTDLTPAESDDTLLRETGLPLWPGPAIWLESLRLLNALLREDLPQALHAADRLEPVLRGTHPLLQGVVCFWATLARATLLDHCGPGMIPNLSTKLHRGIGQLRRWADLFPQTFAHRYHLAMALHCRLHRRSRQAMEHHQIAIHLARIHHFPLEQALALELAGRFHRQEGPSESATILLDQACSAYKSLGMRSKAADLRRRYPELSSLAPSPETRADQPTLETLVACRELSRNILTAEVEALFLQHLLERSRAKRGLLVFQFSSKPRIVAEYSRREGLRQFDLPLDALLLGNPLLPTKPMLDVLAKGRVWRGSTPWDYRTTPVEDLPYFRSHLPTGLWIAPLLTQEQAWGAVMLEFAGENRPPDPEMAPELDLYVQEGSITLSRSLWLARHREEGAPSPPQAAFTPARTPPTDTAELLPLLGATGHDLAQPLSALGLLLAQMERTAPSERERQRTLAAQSALAELAWMVEALITMAKSEATTLQVLPRLLPVQEVMAGVLRRLGASPGLRHVTSPLMVQTDPRLLELFLVTLWHHTHPSEGLLGARRHQARVRLGLWYQPGGEAPSGPTGAFRKLLARLLPALASAMGARLTDIPTAGRLHFLGLELPLAARARNGSEAETTGPNHFDLSVLIVDDEPSILHALEGLLRLWGCQVEGALSAEEALLRVENRGEPYDLVLSDLNLGPGIDGWQLLRHLRERGKGNWAIFTGRDAWNLPNDPLAEQVHRLSKPVPPEALRALLRKVQGDKTVQPGKIR
ncbi:MAG: response regulator [Magnetococcales bacterium]|nr:response regulator [Magnetococcales bacterium]